MIVFLLYILSFSFRSQSKQQKTVNPSRQPFFFLQSMIFIPRSYAKTIIRLRLHGS